MGEGSKCVRAARDARAARQRRRRGRVRGARSASSLPMWGWYMLQLLVYGRALPAPRPNSDTRSSLVIVHVAIQIARLRSLITPATIALPSCPPRDQTGAPKTRCSPALRCASATAAQNSAAKFREPARMPWWRPPGAAGRRPRRPEQQHVHPPLDGPCPPTLLSNLTEHVGRRVGTCWFDHRLQRLPEHRMPTSQQIAALT